MSKASRRVKKRDAAMRKAAGLPPQLPAPPSLPGAYALVVAVPYAKEILFGRRRLAFRPGLYIYLGSALGPGGLHARLGRHLRPADAKRPHWHIDRLLEWGWIVAVWWEATQARRECAWAAALGSTGQIWPPRFGASDCNCTGHLVAMPSDQALRHAWDILKSDYPAIRAAALSASSHRSGA